MRQDLHNSQNINENNLVNSVNPVRTNTGQDFTAEDVKKLDTLKTHKKGLMQQLFPATEEKT